MLQKTPPMALRLAAVTPRGEKHGKRDIVSGYTVTFVLVTTSDFLDNLLPGLRAWFFTKRESMAVGAQPAMELDCPDPNVRWPQIRYPVVFDITFPAVTIHYTFDGSRKQFVVDDNVLKAFELTPKEGGMVEVKFKAHRSKSEKAEHGEIDWRVGHEINVQLEYDTGAAQASLGDQDEDDGAATEGFAIAGAEE